MGKEKMKKQRLFEIIQIGQETDLASRIFDLFLVCLILLNIALAICLTFEELSHYEFVLHTIEAVTVVCFTIEFLLRLWTAEFLYHRGSILSALRYLFSFNGIVELFSIIPFYLPLLFPKGIVVFRMFRVVRILRLFQLNNYSDALTTIMIVLKRKRRQMLSSMLIIFVIMLMSSLVMYGFEHNAQPDVFRNAFSGIWWSTSTLLTVGYGDIYPITIAGQIASIAITFLGVGMIAIPTGILSAGFTEFTSEQRDVLREQKDESFCPRCGKKLFK